MRKSIILLIFLMFSLEAYPFWIWSPKTQEWKNPKYSALATPYLQYKQALKYFEEDKFKESYEEFKKLLVNYPDAKEAAEAQYYLGRCLEKFDKHYDAFLEYQKLINSYPNSQRINEVVEREYNIGEYFLNRERKEWLGLSVYDFVEHPSIAIFEEIVNKVPYSEYAPRAQYKLGIIFLQLSRYEESRASFQRVIDNYPDSEWATPAKYQLAIATSQAFSGADYDSSYLKEATGRLDEFIKEHPEAKISSQAEDQLKVLRNKEAKKLFNIGQFYESQDKYESSIIYYKKVVNNYPNSDYHSLALGRIEELEELIAKNITKDELKKREKGSVLTAKREEKLRKKEEAKARKKALREERIAKKEAIRAEKLRKKEEMLRIKQERIQKKKDLKEQRRQDKLKRKAEVQAKKNALKEEKIRGKEKRREEKKALEEERRQAKIEKKEKARARKKALREEKTAKKEAARAEKLRKKEEAKARKKALREERIAKKEAIRAEKLRKKEEMLKKKQEQGENKRSWFWFW